MTSHEISRTIREAQGFAELGMHLEAWETIETLPAGVRLHAAVIALRIMVCRGLREWGVGLELCRFSQGAPDTDLRESMGRFYLAFAECLCAAGDADSAREYVQEMGIVWPDGIEMALASKALQTVW